MKQITVLLTLGNDQIRKAFEVPSKCTLEQARVKARRSYSSIINAGGHVTILEL